jgi:hypothetical protein
LKINTHVANEKLYFAQGLEILLQQVAHDAIIEKKKFINFVLIFHLFKHCCPINDCTTMQRLCIVNVFDYPKNHWSYGVGWEITHLMCDQMLRKSQNVMVWARFIFFSVV